MRPTPRTLCCALALLLLAAPAVAAQKAKSPAAPDPASQEGFTHCVEDWKAGPVAIYGKEDGRFRLELELPDSCRDKPIFYEITGRDRVQRADCDLTVIYGSGGSSEKMRIQVMGTETKKGEIPSYLKEPSRRLRVRCFALDEYKPFDVRLCASCGESGKKDDAFDKDLEKFLKQ